MADFFAVTRARLSRVLRFYSPLPRPLSFFLYFFCFYLTDSRGRSPGPGGVLGLGDEVEHNVLVAPEGGDV